MRVHLRNYQEGDALMLYSKTPNVYGGDTGYCFEELICDVLEAAGVEYWIISPKRTYRI